MKKQVFIQQGDKYGRLTALKYLYTGKHHRRYILFRCDCGTEKILQAANVSSGNTKSCGCLSREIARARRLSDNHSEVTAIILGYKRHAEGRGFDFLLSREEVKTIINQPCYYCGQKPSNLKVTKNSLSGGLLYSGIDRVNSSKGYLITNCVPCCTDCNRAKNDMSLDMFKKWVKRLFTMANQWG